MNIKRGSIDLKMPTPKKQRKTSAQSPTNKNQQKRMLNEKDMVSSPPVSTPPSTVATPNSQFVSVDGPRSSTAGSPASQTTDPTKTPQQQNIQPQQVQLQMNHQSPTNMAEGMASNAAAAAAAGAQMGMAANQRQAQSAMVYQAAISSGISPQIVSLLPPRALQCSWLLQQSAQGKIALTPGQQQQIRILLNDRIEVVKAQLAKQASEGSSPQPQMPQQQIQQIPQLEVQQPEVQQIQPQQVETQIKHEMQQPLSLSTISAVNPSYTAEQNDNRVKAPLDVLQAKINSEMPIETVQQYATNMSSFTQTQPKYAQMANSTTTNVSTMAMKPSAILRPGMGPDEIISNTMLFTNDVLKDVASILDRSASEVRLERHQLEVVRDGKHCTLAFDNISSALKEGYKDETFGTAELSPLFRRDTTPGLIREDDPSTSWYDVGMDVDIPGPYQIMEGFDWREDLYGSGYYDVDEEQNQVPEEGILCMAGL
ncbi:hypothetical protein CLU79DRAFT_782102 [Phycomyces nitens]|nr:hypothetical protein CLU79DRAFT_782102 [Phycomyces nitens]